MSFREGQLTVHRFAFKSELVLNGVEVEDPEYILESLAGNVSLDDGQPMIDITSTLLGSMNHNTDDLTVIISSEEMSIEGCFGDEGHAQDFDVYFHFNNPQFLEKGQRIIISDIGFNVGYDSDDLSFEIGFFLEDFNQNNFNDFAASKQNNISKALIASRVYFDLNYYLGSSEVVQHHLSGKCNDFTLTDDGMTSSNIVIDGSLCGSILRKYVSFFL